MKLLLDTHVWLWQLLEPERLSRRAAAALADPTAELYFSPLSVWETLLLAEKRRILLEPDPVAWVRDALRTSPLASAELTHEVVIRSRQLEGFRGRDPVDRLLAATCLVAGMTLVTRDSALRKYRGLRTLW
ncbi:MAG: type II toxin-antitoxin system VapC family toxin [Candidatus Binatia bacterium]